MSSCNTFPTLTRTDAVVMNSLSTSTTTRVGTLPASTTTFTIFPSCTATTGPCSTSPIVTTSQVPGGATTIVEVVTITVPITSSELTTLFGTSCTRTAQDTDTNTFTPPPPTPTPTTTSFSTPSPSVFVTSSVSTQSNGNVTPVVLTVTSTQSPIAVLPSAAPGSVEPSNGDNSKNLGPIIGGVVGGVVGLTAIAFIIWFLLRRRRRWDDIFDNEDDVPAFAAAAMRKEKPAEMKPQPYQYGIVGHTKSPSLTSPPSSPPPGAGLALADNKLDHSHHRHSSNTPLLHSALSTTSHGTTAPSPRPPSSVGSMQGYGLQDTNVNVQGQGWDPSYLYNPTVKQQAQFAGMANAATTMMGRRDTDPRAGSPVSLQEQRQLQVTNADFGLQSPVSPAPPEPQMDGKGRFVTQGGKAPIVHLDGGRFQGAVAGSSSAAAGPAPPAYSE